MNEKGQLKLKICGKKCKFILKLRLGLRLVFKEQQSLHLQGHCNCKRNAKVSMEWDELFRESRENSAALLVVSNLDTRINIKSGHVQGKEVSFRLGR